MTWPVVYRRRVQSDLAAAFGWYERQQPELGDEFLSAVLATLESVKVQPELFACVHGVVRRALISRFPFAIF